MNQKYQLKCINNNTIQQVCINPKCLQNPVICAQKINCKCSHQQCQKFDWIYINKKLNDPQLKKQVEYIDLIKKIDIIFQQSQKVYKKNRIEYQKWKQNFGNSKKQLEFVQLLTKQKSNLKGSHFLDIKNQLKKKSRIIAKNQKQFQSVQLQIKQSLAKLTKSLKSLYSQIHIIKLQNQHILKLSNHQQYVLEKIPAFFNRQILSINKLYKASQYQFKVEPFWKLLHKKTDTLTLIQTQYGKIIGAYTPIPWIKPEKPTFLTDTKKQTFLFSINQMDKFVPIAGKQQHMIYHNGTFGPTFGKGYDIVICEDGNKHLQNYANIGFSYGNSKYEFGSKKSWIKFSGGEESRRFKILEWLVYEIRFK